MAKAIYGFVGGPTVDQVRETASLRRRVADLEAEVLRLKTENDSLNHALAERVEALHPSDLLEPVAH